MRPQPEQTRNSTRRGSCAGHWRRRYVLLSVQEWSCQTAVGRLALLLVCVCICTAEDQFMWHAVMRSSSPPLPPMSPQQSLPNKDSPAPLCHFTPSRKAVVAADPNPSRRRSNQELQPGRHEGSWEPHMQGMKKKGWVKLSWEGISPSSRHCKARPEWQIGTDGTLCSPTSLTCTWPGWHKSPLLLLLFHSFSVARKKEA